MIYLLLLTNYIALMTSLVAQTVKHLPTEQETWVQSMGREDLLEKGMATHSGILAHPPHKKGAPRNVWKNQGTSQNSLPSSLLNKLIISHIYWISIICQRLWCAWSLSHIWLFAIPWTVAHQAPLSIGILQARTLEWVAMPSSRGSYQPRDWAQVSCIADSLPSEPPGKPMNTRVGSLSLLWGIFPSQGSNWGLLHCKLILYQLW